MTVKKISIILFLNFIFYSCKTTKLTDFFRLKENKVEVYNGFFVKYADTNYRRIEQLFGSISNSDTVNDKTEIIYKTIIIEGHKAFYAVKTVDTILQNPSIGLNHFLFSSLIFLNDKILIAPVDKKADLIKLKLTDFKYAIPSSLTSKDSVEIIDDEKRIVLCNFRKTKFFLGKKQFKNCLTFEVREIWPDALYVGNVWLNRKYGILKWVRSTGRIETRIL